MSKKNALGRAHGFADETQGTLFFDVARIIAEHRPKAFLLENVKNLVNHDKGRTFAVFLRTLRGLGYHVPVPRVINAKGYVPQHRERILIAGFREECDFTFDDLDVPSPLNGPKLKAILHPEDGSEKAVQYYGLLEHVPFLEKFGLMDRKTAQELLKCEIDTHAYEMDIGRNFNHRKSDKSSIHKNVKLKHFLQRPDEDDIPKLLAEYKKVNPYSFFVAHELIPNAKIYFDTFPGLKMVSLRRSPAELVDSWYRRGLAKRFAGDPTIFIVTFKKGLVQYPWYMDGDEKEYGRLPEMDRTIFMIEKMLLLYMTRVFVI